MVRRIVGLCVFAVAAIAAPVRGDISIEIGGGTFPVGGSSLTIDIFVVSDNNDKLQTYSADFTLTRVLGTGSLTFQTPDASSYTTSPSYVFAGDTGMNPGDPSVNFGASTDTNFPGADLFVGDSSYSGNDVTLTTGTKYLLAELLIVPGAIAPQAGDQYTLSLTPAADPVGTTHTFFQDEFSSPIAFTSTSGSISVSARAVPEPASLVLALCGLVPFAFMALRKGRGGVVGAVSTTSETFSS